MSYVKITNGAVEQYPYTLGNLRRDNPNVSFPKNPTNELLADWGVYPVTITDPPFYNQRTQLIEIQSTPTLNGDSWEISYNVVDKTPEQISLDNEQEAASNRSIRNKILTDSDWTQMNDSPLSNEMKSAWAIYREELRNITDLAAWPNLEDADWPVAP